MCKNILLSHCHEFLFLKIFMFLSFMMNVINDFNFIHVLFIGVIDGYKFKS